MSFTLDTWKANLKQRLPGWRSRMQDAGVTSAYAAISAAAIWPVVEAVRNGQWAALAALGAVVAGVGSNLLANQLQDWKDERDAARQLAEAVLDQPALRAEIDVVLVKLDALTAAREALPEADRAWYVETLRAELGRLGSPLRDLIIAGGDVTTGGSASAKDKGLAFVGNANTIISGKVLGDVIQVYHTAPGKARLKDAEVERILGEYLRWVRDAYDRARLFGLESAPAARPTSVRKLTEVFIPLTLRRFKPPTRRELEETLGGKAGTERMQAWFELNRDEGRAGEVIGLDRLLTLSDQVAIVGGAGSGKSTVLAYLAATLAAAAQTGEETPYKLQGKRLPIPLIVPLRYYRDYLEKCCGANERQLTDPRTGTLAGFIPWYLRRRSPALELSEDFFDRLLLGRGCLLMIDGLDEITSRDQRGHVRQEVDNLVHDIYPGNRLIVTAREAGYREEAVFGDDFTRLDVQDLDEGQIAMLVENWCGRLYPEDVAGNRDKLVAAVRYINDLRQERNLPPLISTPLMTTMVVSVQWGETELPRERARLYEACVKAIIQAQYIPDDPARQALIEWGGPWEAQRDWLSELALAMHAGGRGGAAVREESVRAMLAAEVGAEDT